MKQNTYVLQCSESEVKNIQCKCPRCWHKDSKYSSTAQSVVRLSFCVSLPRERRAVSCAQGGQGGGEDRAEQLAARVWEPNARCSVLECRNVNMNYHGGENVCQPNEKTHLVLSQNYCQKKPMVKFWRVGGRRGGQRCMMPKQQHTRRQPPFGGLTQCCCCGPTVECAQPEVLALLVRARCVREHEMVPDVVSAHSHRELDYQQSLGAAVVRSDAIKRRICT